MLFALLLIIFALFIVGIPRWPHSTAWGWGPSGGFGLLLVVVILILLFGANNGGGGVQFGRNGCSAHF